MKTPINILVVAVTIIGIVLGLIAYSYTQVQFSLENISYQGLDFAYTSPSTYVKLVHDLMTGNWLGVPLSLVIGVKMGLVFGLANHGFFPVYIPNASYDILVNNVKIGQGQTHMDSTINPGQTSSFNDTTQDIQFSSLEPAITSIVSSGGIANFQLSGTAYLNFLGINIPIPFQSSKQVNIGDELKNHFENFISNVPQRFHFHS